MTNPSTKARIANALPAHLHLQAIDPSRNIARDYQIYAARDLFGHWIIETHWGRIGMRGQQKTHSFTEIKQAAQFIRTTLARRANTRRRFGVAYQYVS
jgi:predicted DNA-binding WGR domain protein